MKDVCTAVLGPLNIENIMIIDHILLLAYNVLELFVFDTQSSSYKEVYHCAQQYFQYKLG